MFNSLLIFVYLSTYFRSTGEVVWIVSSLNCQNYEKYILMTETIS